MDNLDDFRKYMEYVNSAVSPILNDLKHITYSPFLDELKSIVRSSTLTSGLNVITNSPSIERIQSINSQILENYSPITGLKFSSLYKRAIDVSTYLSEISLLNEEEYNEKFSARIKRANLLGKNGWVISQHTSVGVEKEIVARINNGENESAFVSEFITDDIKDLEIANLETIYTESSLCFYFSKFKEVYANKDYTSSAFYLCAILDRRVKVFVEQYKHITKKIRDGIDEEREKYIEKKLMNNSQKLIDLFVLVDFFPSLDTFLERLFIDGDYDFEKGIEPPYLNRNWLDHGMMTKPVEEYQILQLLNALDTLEVVIQAKEKQKKY